MIAMGMSDEIGIGLGAGLGSAAGIYGEEMGIEANGKMGSTAATAVDPSHRLNAALGSCALHHPPSLPPSSPVICKSGIKQIEQDPGKAAAISGFLIQR